MSGMTVGELIEQLQEYPENAQVHLALQQNYPLESLVYGVTEGRKGGVPASRYPFDEDDDEMGTEDLYRLVAAEEAGSTAELKAIVEFQRIFEFDPEPAKVEALRKPKDDGEDVIVYITEGRQVGYASKELW